MQMSKRGQIGGVVMGFWVTVMVLIILAIFIATASLMIAFSKQKVGVESVVLLNIDDYMKEFKTFVETNTVSSSYSRTGLEEDSTVGEVI